MALSRLRAWRLENGLTQAQAAAAMGISVSLYGDLEANRYRPTDRVKHLIESYFGQSADAVLAPARVRGLQPHSVGP